MLIQAAWAKVRIHLMGGEGRGRGEVRFVAKRTTSKDNRHVAYTLAFTAVDSISTVDHLLSFLGVSMHRHHNILLEDGKLDGTL